MNTFVPVLVRAELQAGVACGPHGIALDGLLASVLHARGGPSPLSLLELDDPDVIDLPLARCGDGLDDWHWAATSSYPLDGHTLPPDVRYWVSHLDDRDVENLATPGSLPKVLSNARGRYRSQHQPLLTTICTALTWTAVGDPGDISELLQQIPAIGKRRAHGHGRVTEWSVTPCPTQDPWTAGHVDEHGDIARPLPPRCITNHPDAQHSPVDVAGLRPPYRHPATHHQVHLPKTPAAP